MQDIKIKSETGWKLDNTYANLPKTLFSNQNPTPVEDPKLVILNQPLAELLGLKAEFLRDSDNVAIFAGNNIAENSLPIAQAYAGHQFGYFNMLGDGRAILLGEQITPNGERFDIQLKGSGRTPYSRGGDGRAALGPMLREYIISEAMHGLGIPTTRSLAVVTTGESVIRENVLSGAILTRVASSHIRVATFQYAAEWGTIEELKALADYTIKRHFPNGENLENPYIFLLQEVIKLQASLISKWQLVGFIHGVMNTDNMAISGETIDYGPCAFMDTYDPATVFSSIDREGRYSYRNQPPIAEWNLARFAETLLPLLHSNHEKSVEIAQNELLKFEDLYHDNWLRGMRSKLGIFNKESQDEVLIENLLSIMHKYKADYTNTFSALTLDKCSDMDLFNTKEFDQWRELWNSRLNRQQESKESSNRLMKNSNPSVIPRNYRVEEALEAAEKGDYTIMEKLLHVLSNPYAYAENQYGYEELPPKSFGSYRTFCGT